MRINPIFSTILIVGALSTAAQAQTSYNDSARNNSGTLENNVREVIGIQPVGMNSLPAHANVLAEGEILSISHNQVSLRDARSGSLYIYLINDTKTLNNLKEGEQAKIFSRQTVN